MSELVVPDSIEPYKGFKALTIGPDGKFYSPTESGVCWPPRSRLEAVCTRSVSQWNWVPVDGPARELDATKLVPHGTPLVSTAVVWGSSSGGPLRHTTAAVPKPDNPLPPGWNWSWEPLIHNAPAEGCGCGIYAVSRPQECISYVKADGVIVEVALWGNVVPATSGARGQYAYPQRILVPAEIVPEVQPTADLYGIPLLVLDAPERREEAFAVAEGQTVDVTGMGDPIKKTITATPIATATIPATDPVWESFKESFKESVKKLGGK